MCTWDAENERYSGRTNGTPPLPNIIHTANCEFAAWLRGEGKLGDHDAPACHCVQTRTGPIDGPIQDDAIRQEEVEFTYAGTTDGVKTRSDVGPEVTRFIPEEAESIVELGRIPDRLREIFDGPDPTPRNSITPEQQIREIIDTVEELISQSIVSIVSTMKAQYALATAERVGNEARAAQPTEVAPPAINDLGQWWMDLAEAEFGDLAAKMREYGGEGRAWDLVDIGEALRASGVKFGFHPDRDPSQAELQELGVYFYLVGKFGRWKAAVAEGRPVSDDTLHDIGVYVRMAQRIRQSGGWPN